MQDKGRKKKVSQSPAKETETRDQPEGKSASKPVPPVSTQVPPANKQTPTEEQLKKDSDSSAAESSEKFISSSPEETTDETIPEIGSDSIPEKTSQADTAPVERTGRRGTGSLPSIKDAINGVHKREKGVEAANAPVEKPVLNDPFKLEDLIGHWNDYTETIKDRKPRMAGSLKHHLPTLGDALQIEVILSNTAQLEEFNIDIKPELISFLEKALNNNQFKLIPVVKEEEDQKNTLYTSEEKYEHMLNKNPELGKLKDRFNLDFE